ncbi:MAG TPA: isocitrate/isopropylmalate family dehydrogenase, partial [Longimicrobiaceae bacterium]|nr:isocitrate/isopropylmalate family dehydrogenase [Longimicrobiaceae bacterium]
PCKSYEGVRSRFENIDIVFVRENTEDLYAGIEFEVGTPAIREISDIGVKYGQPPIREDAGLSLKPISRFGSERIVRYAFNYARDNGRKKVTAICKANIMKYTDGLFYEVAREVAKDFPDIEYDEWLIDAMCMQLVQKPENYDVLVLPNLYGDILSDLGAGLVGGLGVAPGANIGEVAALFEATHGSAPKYTGMNKVNPMAVMFSAVLMLRYLGEREKGDLMERAMSEIIAEGKDVTYDMKPHRDDPTAVGTSQVADAIIARMDAIRGAAK